MPDVNDAAMAVHLAEYAQIKTEQRERIQHRDSLVYTPLAAMAAMALGAVQVHYIPLLLLIPPVIVALGWKYVANDEKIGAVAVYIRDRMAPRLAGLIDTTIPMFDWERVHRAGVFYRVRKYVQCAADLLIFCVLPGCALVASWVFERHAVIIIVASIFEAVLLAGMAVLVTVSCLKVPTRKRKD